MRAATAIDLAERSGDPDLIFHAIEVGAYAALARGETTLARQLFVRAVADATEHELPMLPQAMIGLAIVSALTGDLAVARSCRDELNVCDQLSSELDANRRLACAFVDLMSGAPDNAAEVARKVAHDTEVHGQIYLHVLSLELVAASIALSDPTLARDLLTSADQERTAVGATAWPLDPYRHVALRRLDGSTRGDAMTMQPSDL